jgi:hypothetical protein
MALNDTSTLIAAALFSLELEGLVVEQSHKICDFAK